MLHNLRPEGFDGTRSGVGIEIVKLIQILIQEFDFKQVVLKLNSFPELLGCLNVSSSRRCCVDLLMPQCLPFLKDSSCFSGIVQMFACLTQMDLVQSLSEKSSIDEDEFKSEISKEIESIGSELSTFTKNLIQFLPGEFIEEFFVVISSPSSCLNLFLLPELLEASHFKSESLCKRVISEFLGNTSTVLPQRIISNNNFAWIEGEYTKMMAVKMYLRVIDVFNGRSKDTYEFYTEVSARMKLYV